LTQDISAWFAGRADKVIETSCARVFLTPEAAFKIKRPVAFGFLDFSTVEKRRWALERELAFNAATAPDIYRAMHAVTRTPEGGLTLDGDGPVVDYALEMRRFDETAVLGAQPDAIDASLAETLGRTVADVHAAAPLRPDGGGGAALKYTLDSNAEVLRGLARPLGAEAVEALIAAVDVVFRQQEELLNRRARAGFARRCHGDLHLGNILLEAGRPILFDCIEFNDRLSDIDVQYDLAFLLMDLAFRDRRDAANRVLNAYLDQAGRHFGAAVVEGLAALPLMMAARAAVRAHVCAHAGEVETGRAYLAAALAHLSPAPARLVAVGGLSGTGKSTFARLIAPGLGGAPGALVLRTDEIRKQLAGRPTGERLPAAAYAPERQAQVYEALFDMAARSLAAGRAVILDATFIQPRFRRRAEDVARQAGVGFEGLWLEAPPEILRARIEGRAGDASDATAATLEAQLAEDPGPIAWTRRDVSGSLGALAADFGTGEGVQD